MNKEINAMIEEFNLVSESKEPCNAQINIRLPESKKAKYDELQKMSENRLSKLIYQAIVKIIDSVN